MDKYTIEEKVILYAKTINVDIGKKVKTVIKLLDENKNELSSKEDSSLVNRNDGIESTEYSFTTKDLAKEFAVDPLKIRYVSGWIDADDDKEISREYNEEVIIEIEEAEEKITIIVELPHSKRRVGGAKGLAGHTAMAIGERFFDYGPDYDNNKIFDEKNYQSDLNQDGDIDDKAKITLIKKEAIDWKP